MFKKTRRKIVAAIMSVLVVLFIGLLTVIYAFSYNETYEKNMNMLRHHAKLYSVTGDGFRPDASKPVEGGQKPGEPDFENTPEYQLSSFYTVAISENGSIIKTNNSNNVYTDEELWEAAREAYGSSKSSGTLGSLIYYRENRSGYTLIAFMDNRLIQSSISTLFKYTLACGSIAIVLFFFLSLQLAKMIVRPLEESYTKQKQFISDAGHELKTPVSIINANAELLARETGDSPWLANIQYENGRMSALVTQLLELARTENVAPQQETVDFSRLVRGEALPFDSVAFERGLTLTSDIAEGITVFGCPEQLSQLVSILLDNAVRHSAENGRVSLSLSSCRGHALLEAENDGAEIPPEQRKQIFERFYRADTARNGEDKHYGLGLAIAKAIVSSHKGKIDVTCGGGRVRFSVRIPLQK